MKLIATKKEQVSQYPIDFFSIGHIIFGYMCYITVYLVTNSREWSLILSIVAGILWEIFENCYLINTNLKENKDSVENSLADLLFDFLGSCVSQSVSFLSIELYIGITTMIMILLVWMYTITEKFTNENKNGK